MISLGGNIGIGLAVSLHNRFSAQARAISTDFANLYGSAQRALKNNLQATQQIGGAMALAGGVASKAFWGATKDAMKFNYTLTSTQAVTGRSKEEIAALKAEMMKLNITSIYGAQQLGESAYELTKSGFSLRDAIKAMKGVSQFGAAGDMANLGGKEGAAGIMAHALNTFMLGADQSERVADVMAYAANKSSVDLIDMAHSLNYVGSEASLLKIPVEDVASMLGVLGNAGIRGTSAGVAMANMLSYLSKAATEFRTKKQASMLEAVGIDPRSLLKANGELKDMVDVVDIFRVAMSKMSGPRQSAILQNLLNIRGGKGFVKLFQNPEIGMQFRDFQESLKKNAPGTTARIAKMKIDTPFGRIEVLQSTLENMRILIGDHLIPLTDRFIKGLIWVFDRINAILKTPWGKALVWLAAGFTAAVTIAGTLMFTISTIKLVTMATGVSARGMGRALVWAWNSAAAAAMRYAAVAQGANMTGKYPGTLNKIPSYIPGKGFGGGMKGVGGVGGMSWMGRIGKFFGTLARGEGILGRVFSLFRGLGGVLAGAVLLFGTMVGWKNVFKGLIYGLGTLVQALAFVYDYITNVFKVGPIDAFSVASENFSRRQATLRESMGFEKIPLEEVARRNQSRVNPYENTSGLKEIMERNLDALKKKGVGTPTVAPVYLDSNKVGDVIDKKTMQYLEGTVSN